MKQRTIQQSAVTQGIGLHTGKMVKMTFLPAAEGHGYKFKRIDLAGAPVVGAEVGKVVSTNRGTVIKAGEAQISTIEHVLSALVGLEIDNVLIEIDGAEVPIMDGSANHFIEILLQAA